MATRDTGDIYSQAQVIAAISTVSTVVDFFDPSHQIGQMVKPQVLHVVVNAAFTGPLTVFSIYWQDAPQAPGSFGPNALPGAFENTGVQIINIPKAALVSGTDLLVVPIPLTGGLVGIVSPDGQPNSLSGSPIQRYTQFLYVCDQIPTTGSIDAWIQTF